jgi:hypothetical protein
LPSVIIRISLIQGFPLLRLFFLITTTFSRPLIRAYKILFSAAIFLTKLPNLAVLRDTSTPVIRFIRLRTSRIFDIEYIVDVDKVNLLVPSLS